MGGFLGFSWGPLFLRGPPFLKKPPLFFGRGGQENPCNLKKENLKKLNKKTPLHFLFIRALIKRK